MFKNHPYKLFSSLILTSSLGLFFPVFGVFAQDGSALPPSDASSAPTAVSVATSTETVSPAPRPIGTEVPVISVPPPRPTAPGTSASTTPSGVAPSIPPPPPANPAPAEVPKPLEKVNTPEETGSYSILWPVFGGFALLVVGLLAAQLLKNKKTKEKEYEKEKFHCFDLKRLLEDKIKELTDLKEILEGRLEDKAREELREAAKGTSAEEILALIERAEKEYLRIKKLYEVCMVEFDEHVFKGIIIENSLNDKSILENVKIEKTYQTGDWTLHNIFLKETQISEISKYLADGPWCVHLWEQGKDEVRVVFKDRIFTIKYSDKSTWADAVAYGKSIGIPGYQLDFPID